MQQKTKFLSRDGEGLQFSPKNKKLIREVKFFLTASPRIYNSTNVKMSKKQNKISCTYMHCALPKQDLNVSDTPLSSRIKSLSLKFQIPVGKSHSCKIKYCPILYKRAGQDFC